MFRDITGAVKKAESGSPAGVKWRGRKKPLTISGVYMKSGA
jgi:hypothetical protein